ncbi:hypothetical protein GWK47_037810 [Chionoecetes opilio]|uniref:Uncharacterized protein n=1 Tax=Chionoecetes opilio TaxID=41210 RepID=A0A8J4YEP7_CHIOP|nr:hypothetical protein GWK47_037810 [Chionoecetes opilio]
MKKLKTPWGKYEVRKKAKKRQSEGDKVSDAPSGDIWRTVRHRSPSPFSSMIHLKQKDKDFLDAQRGPEEKWNTGGKLMTLTSVSSLEIWRTVYPTPRNTFSSWSDVAAHLSEHVEVGNVAVWGANFHARCSAPACGGTACSNPFNITESATDHADIPDDSDEANDRAMDVDDEDDE